MMPSAFAPFFSLYFAPSGNLKTSDRSLVLSQSTYRREKRRNKSAHCISAGLKWKEMDAMIRTAKELFECEAQSAILTITGRESRRSDLCDTSYFLSNAIA